MKKILVALLVAVVVAFAGVTVASAQSESALVKVPFPFIVNGKLLPAGNYRIMPQQSDPALLQIEGIDHKVGAFTNTEWAGAGEVPDSPVHVAFKNVDGHYFLSQVTMPGQDTRLIPITTSEAVRVLTKLNLMPAEHADVTK